MWTYSFFTLFPGVSIFFREGSEAKQGVAVFSFFRVPELVGAWVYRAKKMDDPEGEGRMLFAPVQIVVIPFILKSCLGLEVV